MKCFPLAAVSLAFAGASMFVGTASAAVVLEIPGSANPWLAGMPDGSLAGNGFDSAPAQSPVQVSSSLVTAVPLTFTSITGTTSYGPGFPLAPAEGDTGELISRVPGAENGIADLTGPLSALIGVYLDDSQPSLSPAPTALIFSTPASRNFLSLAPQLRQPFYIGDGMTDSLQVQQFVAPAGATRLFLGTLDGFGWFNNVGLLTVTVAPIPEPASAAVLLPALALLARRRK